MATVTFLTVWTHGIDRLNQFYNCINSYNSSIRFMFESTVSTGQLPFLDTMITLYPTGEYSTELYFKPMTAPIILHYTSAHPMSTKRTVLNSEIKRAIRVSSDQRARETSISRIKILFEQNGYPSTLIDKAIQNNVNRRLSWKNNPRNRKEEKKTFTCVSLISTKLPLTG